METLPKDVILYLFAFVDGITLITSISVLNKRLRSCATDELIWKEKCQDLPADHRPPNHSRAWQFLWRSKNILIGTFGIGSKTFPGEARYTGMIRDGRCNGFGVFADYRATYIGEWKDDKKHGVGRRKAGICTYVGVFVEDRLPSGEILFDDGERYSGEFLGYQCHGTGTYTWSDGSVHTGQWFEGIRNGQGVHCWESGQWKGDRYEGEWKGDQHHGHGIYKWNDGRIYCGEWKNHMRHGQGLFTFPDGATYDGTWFEGRRQGYGKQVWANGDCYDGLWNNDEPVGEITRCSGDGLCRDWKRFFLMTKEEQRASIKPQSQ